MLFAAVCNEKSMQSRGCGAHRKSMSTVKRPGASGPRRPVAAEVTHLIGVSLPRSGHHYIENLLRSHLGERRFGYCSEAGHNRCCGQIVCSRVNDVELFLRKSHDYELNIPTDLSNVLYLVQHREPAARVQSALELIARNDPNFDLNDRDYLEFWLAREARYTIDFYRKWIERPPVNAVVIDYDALVKEPAASMKRLFAKLGLPFSREKFEADTAFLKQYKAEARGIESRQPMKVRDVRATTLPLDLISDFDALVREHCPGANWSPRILSHGGKGRVSTSFRTMQEEKKWSDRELWRISRREARKSNPHLVWYLIERLKERSMNHAAYGVCKVLAYRGFALATEKLSEMAYEASRSCMEVGELELAIGLAQEAIRHAPGDRYHQHLKELQASRIELEGGGYEAAGSVREMAEGAMAAHKFDDAVKWYELLKRTGKCEAAMLTRADLQLRLAEAQINAGKAMEADAELSLLLERTPNNAEALFHRAHARRYLGRGDEAIADISRAVELRSDAPAYHRRKGQILLAFGRPADAVVALSAALAIDPGDRRAISALEEAKKHLAGQPPSKRKSPKAKTRGD